MASPAPRVSVVIPLFNGADRVRRAIDSVLSQTIPEFEVIVVDDGSTDAGAEVVKSVEDSRVRLVQQENGGVSAARNAGISEAKAAWIAFLDHDDEWKPEFLATVLGLIERYPECRWAATSYIYRHVDGSVSRPALRGFSKEEGLLSPYFKIAARSMPPVWSSAVMVAKDALNDIGGFPEGIALGEDLLTWARLARKYPLAYTTESLSVYWIRQFEGGRFKRDLNEADPVGEALQELLTHPPRPEGWREYLARWYRIRAWQWLHGGGGAEAFRDSCRSLWYHPTSLRVWGYLLVALLPGSFRSLVLRQPEQSEGDG